MTAPSMMHRDPRPAGFTLVELLVAIAVGVIITFAIAGLFATAGDTVQSARRVSEFNRLASLIERQMRADFERMTRDGVLVIKHEASNSGVRGGFDQVEPAPLFRGQSASERRHRRIDEIVFFARGQFESARPPIAGVTASGGVARIYYGHGMRYDLESTALDDQQQLALRVPLRFDLGLNEGVPLDDPELVLPLGVEPASGDESDLNTYAAEWTLLRHVTVLSEPTPVARQAPANFFGTTVNAANELATVGDGEWQIGLQPAMPSVFRSLNYAYANGSIVPEPLDLRSDRSALSNFDIGRWFIPESGLIDVATTDLSAVRAYVSAMHNDLNIVSDPADPIPNWIAPQAIDTWEEIAEFPPKAYVPALLNLDPITVFTPSQIGQELDYLNSMHAWMRQLLPTDSYGDGARSTGWDDLEDLAGVRMRYEPAPPALLDIVNTARSGLAFNSDFEFAEAYANQLMLSASNFAPRCSEFMVEYSFGQVDPETGDLIWYGGSDFIDADGDGAEDEIAIRPYPIGRAGARDFPWGDPESYLFVDPSNGRRLAVQDPRGGPTSLFNPDGRAPATDELPAHLVPPELISGVNFATDYTSGQPVVSYFGTFDPTYNRVVAPLPANPTFQQRELFERQQGRLGKLDWPWPSLIRVTLSLADQNDPSFEQTYQFVFEIGDQL